MKYFRSKTQFLGHFFAGLLAVGLILAWHTQGFAAPGDLDLSFGNGGIVVTSFSGQYNYDSARTVRVQPDGKIVVCGRIYDDDNGDESFFLARYHPTGALDASFGTNGKIIGGELVGNDIVLQPDGKLVAFGSEGGGTNYRLAILRLNPNGAPDTGFGANGRVATPINSSGFASDGAVQPDGKILAFGTTYQPDFFHDIAIVRYLGDAADACANPIDCADFFVRQHYLDFLSRAPDAAGLAYWTNEITQCGSDADCLHQRRIGVSAAFFVETEFQETGYFVYRLYRASFGTLPAPNQTRANLTYAGFNQDRANLVGGADLEQAKQTLVNNWTQRSRFLQEYPLTLSNADFVNRLFDRAGLTPFTAERDAEIQAMNTQGRSRAQVLRNVLEQPALVSREYNPAFVLMQYFGYLRRDPDQAGYDFWRDILHQQPQNFRGMVCAFLTAAEYQQRFGVATRSNAACSTP